MGPVIAGIFGTILGAIIGGFLSYHFSTRILRRQEFYKAAANFRAAFVSEQRLLSSHSLADRMGRTASDIIKSAIDRHESEMIKFRPFIDPKNVDDFDRAWIEYAGNSRHFEQYSTNRNLDRPEKRELALSRIETLLEFASPKEKL
jgi:hypothetical protein